MMTSKYVVGHAMKVLTKILTHEYSNKKALMFMVGYSDQHWEKMYRYFVSFVITQII